MNINTNNKNAVTKYSLEGMLACAKTSAGLFAISTIFDIFSSNSTKTLKNVAKVAKRAGQFGLIAGATSGIVCLGSIFCDSIQ